MSEKVMETEENISANQPNECEEEDKRIVDCEFNIEGSDEDKIKLRNFFAKLEERYEGNDDVVHLVRYTELWENSASNNPVLQFNCSLLYGLDYTPEQFEEFRNIKSYWIRMLCPIRFYTSRDDQGHVKLTLNLEFFAKRLSLLGHIWIEQAIIKHLLKPNNLVLKEGWFDNSRDRYIYKDNKRHSVEVSHHYMETNQ